MMDREVEKKKPGWRRERRGERGGHQNRPISPSDEQLVRNKESVSLAKSVSGCADMIRLGPQLESFAFARKSE